MGELVLRGRSTEATTIRGALRSALSDGRARVLLIEGDAGSGRTALQAEAVERAGRMGFRVGSGRSDEVDGISPGAPLLVALRSGRDPLLDAGAFAELADLFGDPPFFADRVAGLLEARLRDTPVLICLDDHQWADQLTRFTLRLLIGRLAHRPVVWLLTARPRLDPQRRHELTGHDDVPVDRIRLRPLRPDDVDRIARDHLGYVPGDPVAGVLHTVGTNPYWATRLLGRLRTAGAADDVFDQLRHELAGGVREKLERQSGCVSYLVHLAAVRGGTLPYDEAAELSGYSEMEIRAAAKGADVDRLADAGPSALTFPHELLREAVASDLTLPDRRRLHRQVGEFLLARGGDAGSASAVAPHFVASARPGYDGDAARVLHRAARHGGSTEFPAAGLAATAVRLLDPQETDWSDVVDDCLEVIVETGPGNDALVVTDTALGRARSTDARARIQFFACQALWTRGQVREAQRRIAIVRSWPAVTARTRVRIDAVAALVAVHMDGAAAASAWADDAMAAADELGDDRARRVALRARCEAAKYEGRRRDVLGLVRALHAVSVRPDVTEEIRALQLLDRYDEAAELLAGLGTGSGDGDHAEPAAVRMWQHLELGRLDDARAEAGTTLRRARDRGQYRYEIQAVLTLVQIAVTRGDLAEAQALTRGLERFGDEDGDSRTEGLHLIRLMVAGAAGDRDLVVATVPGLIDSAMAARTAWLWYPTWIRPHTRTCLAAGRADIAESIAAFAETAAGRNPGLSSFEGTALHSRGLVREDPALLGQAVEVLRAGPRPLLYADALTDHGAALLARSDAGTDAGAADTGAATRALRDAVAVYERMGAGARAESARGLLAAAGSTPPRRRRDVPRPEEGWESLTDAERRVAELVGAGNTNRMVARELSISPNTVNTHIRSVFVKLGVHSRVELANELYSDRRTTS